MLPDLDDIGRGVDWGNPMSDINPLDIEDYSVLKGGAASALYGSRGSNGVILITTKRGKKQRGIGVNYSYTYKWIQPYRYQGNAKYLWPSGAHFFYPTGISNGW